MSDSCRGNFELTSQDQDYQCNKPYSHTVPAVASVRCRCCKNRSCTRHYLSKGVHTTDVFGSCREGDGSDKRWHDLHTQRYKLLSEQLKTLKEDEKSSKPTNVRVYLISLAMKYEFCSPLRPNVCGLGWYDVDMYLDPRLVSSDHV